jgi:ubiquinone/menaquinone biosynthesis C-methylase UbiE
MGTDERWQLTDDAAARYERCVARYILSPWAPMLLDAARVVAGEHVLDVACGTGLVAREAARRVGASGRCVGIDLNRGMIAVARSIGAANGPPIEWHEGDALELPFRSRSFEVVLCQQGLQFFPDRVKALREMRRVLVDEGRVAISVWRNAGPYNSAVGAAVARHIGGETATRFLASRVAPSHDELAASAAAAGFAGIQISVSRIQVHLPQIDRFALEHLAATPVAAAVASATDEARAQVASSVAQAMRPYHDGDGVTYLEETNVLTARAS